MKAIELAEYILNELYLSGELITNRKLQSLVCLLQCTHIIKNGTPLFEDDMIATRDFVYIESINDKYGVFDIFPIFNKGYYNRECESRFWDRETKRLIDEMLVRFIDLSGVTLRHNVINCCFWQKKYKNLRPFGTEVVDVKEMAAHYNSRKS